VKVYAMVTELSNRARYVKFGVSCNPTSRVVNVQVGSPLRIERMLVMDCGTDYHARVVEAGLHLEHADSHSSGEWFRFRSGTKAEADAKEAMTLIGQKIFGHAVVVAHDVARSSRPRMHRGKTVRIVAGYEPVVGDRSPYGVKVITRRKLLKAQA